MRLDDTVPKGRKPTTFRLVKFHPARGKTVESYGLTQAQAAGFLATHQGRLTEAEKREGVTYALEPEK